MNGAKVLIIDDAPEYYQKVTQFFGQAGAEIKVEINRRQGLKHFYEWRPDLVIIDISMAPSDGWEICRLLCSISGSPVIVLSSVDKNDEVIRALEMGAANYLTKPLSPEVLLTRARVALRKMNSNHSWQQSHSYQDGHIGIDLDRRQVIVDGEPIHLTKTEYRLLTYLLRNMGHVMSIKQILENVWGPGYQESNTYVHSYISRLRCKLERDPRRPRYLQTEFGLGYRFESRKKIPARI